MRVGSLRQRVAPHGLVEALDGRSGITIDQEAPGKEDIAERSALKDEVALRHVALVPGRQEQILATLSLVRAGIPQVGDVAKPEVVHDAEAVGWTFNDDGALRKVNPGESVNRVGVRRQEERLRVHQGIEDSKRSVHSTNFAHAPPKGHQRSTLHSIEVGLNPALEVE